MGISIMAATGVEEQSVAGAIIAAFLTDPIARWMLPESHRYFAAMPAFIRAFAGGAFVNESAYYADDYAGAALWLPPGIRPDLGALTDVLKRSIPQDRQDNAFAFFEQMGNYHPEEPHWYLPLIGVDPVHQGRGYGSALMKHALQRCDREQKPAYLESSNPRNLSLYIRHGFEIVGTIQVADSPPMFPMLRKPSVSHS